MRWVRWWSTLPLAVGLVLTSLAGVSPAADPPSSLDTKTVDTLVYNNLRDVINRGADLYNAGDWAGCYRLYEGALMTVKPFLSHRSGLQKVIDDARTNAERDSVVYRRAFVVREAIDKIRADIRPPVAKKPEKGTDKTTDKTDKTTDKTDKTTDKTDKTTDTKPKTLWAKLGEEKGVAAVVHEIFVEALADKRVNFTRGKTYTKEDVAGLEQSVVDWISSKTGGPIPYGGKSMKKAHEGMHITTAEFDAFVEDVKKVLDKNKVPSAEQGQVIDALQSTRKDIVEGPKTDDKKTDDKKTDDKKTDDKKTDKKPDGDGATKPPPK